MPDDNDNDRPADSGPGKAATRRALKPRHDDKKDDNHDDDHDDDRPTDSGPRQATTSTKDNEEPLQPNCLRENLWMTRKNLQSKTRNKTRTEQKHCLPRSRGFHVFTLKL